MQLRLRFPDLEKDVIHFKDQSFLMVTLFFFSLFQSLTSFQISSKIPQRTALGNKVREVKKERKAENQGTKMKTRRKKMVRPGKASIDLNNFC